MKEYSSESPFIRLLRAGVLLGTLILIPGVAVCWNLLPKQSFELPSFAESTLAEKPISNHEAEGSSEPVSSAKTEPVVARTVPIRPEPDFGRSSATRLEPTMELNPSTPIDPLPMISAVPGPIKAMNWNGEEEKKAIPIPTAFDGTQAGSILSAAPPSGDSPQQTFPRLESELQTLGAKYYRLEKWGSRGELFRFSCHVAAAEPYSYQKLFEAVDNDGIRVMERVIADIKAWRRR